MRQGELLLSASVLASDTLNCLQNYSLSVLSYLIQKMGSKTVPCNPHD